GSSSNRRRSVPRRNAVWCWERRGRWSGCGGTTATSRRSSLPPVRCRSCRRRVVELEKLGDGVWGWLQPGGGSGVSNAGVVADDDGLTVIDCLMVRSQWEPFAAAVAEIGQPVRRLVLTHAHIDHVGGTKAFPLASVLASPATSALLDQPLMTDAYKA